VRRVGITLGDPAGVGPELVVKLAPAFRSDTAYLIYGELKTFRKACELAGAFPDFRAVDSPEEAEKPGVYLIDMNISGMAVPPPSLTSGFWAKKAGLACEGQTEYLAQAAGVSRFAMMLFSAELRVVLLSTHIPLREVPAAVTRREVEEKLSLLFAEYPRLFGKMPAVGVLGLNPHGGEGGETGREDVEEVLPAVESFREKGYPVEGPLPPDSAFLQRDRYDVFLCMYHDQGLIPFKLLSFGKGVNLTLGLPFPRTSPDHGTAYDIAWKGVADSSSSLKALELLHNLIENFKK